MALLVAVPTLFFALTQTIARTTHVDTAGLFRQNFGAADIYLNVPPSGTPLGDQSAVRAGVVDAVQSVVGSGARVTSLVQSVEPMRLADPSVPRKDRSKLVGVFGYQADDKIMGSTLEMLRGRPARDAKEVVLTQSLASSWQKDVGDQLLLSFPKARFTVVGVARVIHDWNTNAFLLTADSPLTRRQGEERYLVQVPEGMTWARFSTENPELASRMMNTFEETPAERDVAIWKYAQFVDGGPLPLYISPASPWSAVLLVLEFAVLSVIIAAAFATSARRQLVTIGQLGANGASRRIVRWSLAFQGLWSGIVGLAIAAVTFAVFLTFGRGTTERVLARDLPAWRVPPGSMVLVVVVSLVSATVAAWLPARAATRTSVLQALAGRTDGRATSRRLLPAGLGFFGAGVGLEFLTAVGAVADTGSRNTTLYMFSGALGGLLILAGVCCLGPVIVSIFGPLGARTAGVLRLTARSLARGRARSAAVVVGITAFAALGLSASTAYLTSHSQKDSWEPAQNIVAGWGNKCPNPPQADVADSSGEMQPCTLADLPAEVSGSIGETMEGARMAPVRWAQFEPAAYQGRVSDPSRLEIREPGGIAIADELILESVGLSAHDASEFARLGLVWVINPGNSSEGMTVNLGLQGIEDPSTSTARIRLMTTGGAIDLNAHVPRDRPRHSGVMQLLITESKARELGLKIVSYGEIFVQDGPLKEWQRVELQFTQNLQPETATDLLYSALVIPWTDSTIDGGLVEALISAAVLFVTLFIVAIGLSLMAAEGKEERDVLVAIGASPRVLASLASLRAFLLTTCAMVLAVPVGLIPVSLVLIGGRTGATGGIEIPWRTVWMLLCVPVVSYGLTRLVTSITQRARPVTMSRFAFD